MAENDKIQKENSVPQENNERKDATIDEIYKQLDRLYLIIKNSHERMLRMRQLLDFSYSFVLNPKLKFSNISKRETSDETLFDKMKDYYATHSSKYEHIANQVRKKLNTFIHEYAIEEVSEDSVLDILNKVRGLLDSLFNRKTTLPSIPIQKSIFDVNKEQEDAVNSDERVTAVIAGPGTGKTFLIVDRIIRSMRQSNNRRILGLAFSNEAAKNLRTRFDYKVFGTEDFANANLVGVSTIHSFAFNSLKEFYEHTGQEFLYEIIDETEVKKIKNSFKGNVELINNYITENSLLTFDMIIELCLNEIQKENSEYVKYIANQLYEIVVDEVQDLTLDDCSILKALFDASMDLRVFVVGDQRQNIYAFRNGSMQNFLNAGFNPVYFTLKRSYRCPDSVLQYVNKFTFADCKNPPLENPANPGEDLSVSRLDNEESQIQHIVDKLVDLSKSKDFEWSDVAILFSYSKSFDAYAHALNKAKIPFKTFGGTTEIKPEIQAFIYFLGAIETKKYPLLQFLSSLNLENSLEGLKKGCKFSEVIETLKERNQAVPIIELIEKHSLSRKQLLENNSVDKRQIFPIDEICDEYVKIMDVSLRVAAMLKEFVHVIQVHNVNSHTELKQTMSPHIEEFYKFYDTPTVSSKYLENGNSNFVSISTMHSSKGKEWQYVFIPDITEDRIPKYNATLKEINEELKKYYVACTRTKRVLSISTTKSYVVNSPRGQFPQFNRRPSMFVLDLPIVSLK